MTCPFFSILFYYFWRNKCNMMISLNQLIHSFIRPSIYRNVTMLRFPLLAWEYLSIHWKLFYDLKAPMKITKKLCWMDRQCDGSGHIFFQMEELLCSQICDFCGWKVHSNNRTLSTEDYYCAFRRILWLIWVMWLLET